MFRGFFSLAGAKNVVELAISGDFLLQCDNRC